MSALFTCNLCSRSGKVGARSSTSFTSIETETYLVTVLVSPITFAEWRTENVSWDIWRDLWLLFFAVMHITAWGKKGREKVHESFLFLIFLCFYLQYRRTAYINSILLDWLWKMWPAAHVALVHMKIDCSQHWYDNTIMVSDVTLNTTWQLNGIYCTRARSHQTEKYAA